MPMHPEKRMERMQNEMGVTRYRMQGLAAAHAKALMYSIVQDDAEGDEMIRLLDQKDKAIAMEYIRRHGVETAFLYANVEDIGLDNQPDIRRAGDYYGYFEDGALHGICPFYNLGSCIPHYDRPGAIAPLTVLIRNRSFNVLIGMKPVIQPLYEGSREDKIVHEYDESLYMTNPESIPFLLEDLAYDVGDCSNDALVEFVAMANTTCLHNSTTVAEQREAMRQNGNGGSWLVARKDGVYVSQANIQAYTDQLCQIGGVATPEEFRGNGFCKATVYTLCERIRKMGKLPTLFVVKSNTPAVRAYEAIGFKPYADYLFIKYLI